MTHTFIIMAGTPGVPLAARHSKDPTHEATLI